MKNGTLPRRILHALERRGVRFFRPAQLTGALGAAPSISRALRRLVDAKKIERLDRGVYRVLPAAAPQLAFDRAWSNPAAVRTPDKTIAVTMGRPTFRDAVRLCHAYGVPRVRRVLAALRSAGDIAPSVADDWSHRLDAIEEAIGNVAQRQLARTDRRLA